MFNIIPFVTSTFSKGTSCAATKLTMKWHTVNIIWKQMFRNFPAPAPFHLKLSTRRPYNKYYAACCSCKPSHALASSSSFVLVALFNLPLHLFICSSDNEAAATTIHGEAKAVERRVGPPPCRLGYRGKVQGALESHASTRGRRLLQGQLRVLVYRHTCQCSGREWASTSPTAPAAVRRRQASDGDHRHAEGRRVVAGPLTSSGHGGARHWRSGRRVHPEVPPAAEDAGSRGWAGWKAKSRLARSVIYEF